MPCLRQLPNLVWQLPAGKPQAAFIAAARRRSGRIFANPAAGRFAVNSRCSMLHLEQLPRSVWQLPAAKAQASFIAAVRRRSARAFTPPAIAGLPPTQSVACYTFACHKHVACYMAHKATGLQFRLSQSINLLKFKEKSAHLPVLFSWHTLCFSQCNSSGRVGVSIYINLYRRAVCTG